MGTKREEAPPTRTYAIHEVEISMKDAKRLVKELVGCYLLRFANETLLMVLQKALNGVAFMGGEGVISP